MKLSKLSHAVAVASLLAVGASANAAISVSGSAAFTTDYKFRGISQTSNSAAVQGGLTFTHDSGAYLSAWGSSVDSLTGGAEMDILLGYAGTAGDVGYDVGVMRYGYPGANRANFGALPDYNEVYGSVSAYGAKLGVAYSDDYFGETGKFSYVYASYGTEVSGVGLSASVGYNKLYDTGASFSLAKVDDDYIDYKVAASKDLGFLDEGLKGVTVEVAYIGTDLKEADLPGLNVDGSVVATVSKAF
ncbi:MAG: TorF family putative porin [Perlucidibaca sp.]